MFYYCVVRSLGSDGSDGRVLETKPPPRTLYKSARFSSKVCWFTQQRLCRRVAAALGIQQFERAGHAVLEAHIDQTIALGSGFIAALLRLVLLQQGSTCDQSVGDITKGGLHCLLVLRHGNILRTSAKSRLALFCPHVKIGRRICGTKLHVALPPVNKALSPHCCHQPCRSG